ncbi:MAG: hypothetical protein K8R36_20655 [Planctomycetales bacterium]|nr:hypothetical protein [Planctomycetales bacterium]
MDFRRGQLDDRRRRVLMDEMTSGAEVDSPDASSVKKQLRAYSEAVLEDHQPRITELIPVRPFLVTMIVLVALTGIAALETLYIYLQTSTWGSAAYPLAHRFAALDLASRGNVGAWYGACLLALGSAASLVILSVRRHRVDDYSGRYQVWMWTAAALLWGSLDCASGIHHAIGAGLAVLTGQPQLTDLCWLGLYLLVFGALAIRLGIETWHTLSAFSALAVAAVLYIGAGMLALGLWTITSQLVSTVLISSVTLIAHVAVIATLALYARHVCLDAAGKLPLRLRAKDGKKKKKSKAKLAVVRNDDDAADEPARKQESAKPAAAPAAASQNKDSRAGISKATITSPRPAAPQNNAKPGPLASKLAVSSSSRDDDEDDEESDDDSDEQMSKSERRRLKKLARREQQRRAA